MSLLLNLCILLADQYVCLYLRCMSSRRKQVLFSLLPVTLLVMLLVAVEVALMLFDHSLDMPFTVKQAYAGIDWLEINRAYLEKYFPAENVLVPELKPSIMRVTKGRTFRVICLGESTMFGVPYQMNATIPGILRSQLRHRYPGMDVEVINLAASAINSNVILDLAPRVVRLQPDVVILYVGHNEFYGPDGIGASFLERTFPFLTPMKYRLRELRLVRLFQRILHHTLSESGEPTEPNMMRQVSRGARVFPGSPDEERIERQFENNLTGIIETFQVAGIPIVVSDVTGNPMFPPFDYVPHDGFADAERSFEAGRYAEALDRLTALLRVDSTNAFTNYWLGRSERAIGNIPLATSFLQRAIDDDLLRFRAPSKTNEVIAKVCRSRHAVFVSTDSLLRALSPDGIPGDNIFWEHVHPKPEGYYRIADHLLAAMDEAGLLPRTYGDTTILPFQVDSLSICWLDLAYGDVSMRALTTRWPFDNYHVIPAVIGSADPELMGIVNAVYERSVSWDDGCLRSASAFRRKHREGDALTTYRAMIEEFPFNYYVLYLEGNLLKEMGRLPQAAADLAQSIRLDSTYAFSRIEAGLIQVNLGEFDSAIRNLTRALELLGSRADAGPARATIYYGLAGAYANREQYDRALQCINESLKISPTFESALALRSRLLARH